MLGRLVVGVSCIYCLILTLPVVERYLQGAEQGKCQTALAVDLLLRVHRDFVVDGMYQASLGIERIVTKASHAAYSAMKASGSGTMLFGVVLAYITLYITLVAVAIGHVTVWGGIAGFCRDMYTTWAAMPLPDKLLSLMTVIIPSILIFGPASR
mmetsp:Transcript_45275/g.82707  ORF Transcript_45275/g.82707 Transcript_45275/m.82707 type:complete len:154 (+) Transcript_45275:48-509(+)